MKRLGESGLARVRDHVGRWGNQVGLLWVSTALRALKNKVQSCQQIILTYPPFYLFIYWPCHAACGILIPQPGIVSAPCSLEAWCPNPWTAGEVLSHILSNGPRTIFLISPQETQSECLADNFIFFFSSGKSRLLFPPDFSSQRLQPSGRNPGSRVGSSLLTIHPYYCQGLCSLNAQGLLRALQAVNSPRFISWGKLLISKMHSQHLVLFSVFSTSR